jgi:hypothetical protein
MLSVVSVTLVKNLSAVLLTPENGFWAVPLTPALNFEFWWPQVSLTQVCEVPLDASFHSSSKETIMSDLDSRRYRCFGLKWFGFGGLRGH